VTRIFRQYQEGDRRSSSWVVSLFACLLVMWLDVASSSPAKHVKHIPDIVLILSSEAPPLRQVAEGFQERLQTLCRTGTRCPSVVALSLSEMDVRSPHHPRLFVSIGTSAARYLLKRYPTAHQLHLMVSKNTHSTPSSSRVSALFIEQPPGRLLDFVHFLLPERRRIGVLSTEDSQTFVELLAGQAPRHGLDLRDRMIDDTEHIGKQLHALNRSIDLLLALPDPAIFNRQTLATILLACYQDRIPVIGFSAGMTRAGALASLYTPPDKIGSEGAELALRLLHGATPFRAYPQYFEVSINRRVAQALYLHLPTEAELDDWHEEVQ
jgi:ABC-type uncharacterized transport system substrate-binding protein